jgi:hypothetical protein
VATRHQTYKRKSETADLLRATRHCKACGVALRRRANEELCDFATRLTCCRKCANAARRSTIAAQNGSRLCAASGCENPIVRRANEAALDCRRRQTCCKACATALRAERNTIEVAPAERPVEAPPGMIGHNGAPPLAPAHQTARPLNRFDFSSQNLRLRSSGFVKLPGPDALRSLVGCSTGDVAEVA